ncbi:HNH endonuclease signature motif containing protein [Ruminococcus sp.]|uniref:HNH endonuclease n=1 Tax=Ruminococcus sp. TaxID=41978 RepID=UPI001B7B6F5F|nr:HNH endonuclease signature motif containing protein [Ruminococcus sp.]MBP5431564.1 HNH endonuclease [Ruminococcus sp.]
MKKACIYCGKIHGKNEVCEKRPKKIYGQRGSKEDLFRWSYDWKLKREHIMRRDKYLCVVCRDQKRFNNRDLSVHHIRPLKTNFELRLEDDNLITLCAEHHEMAESGKIAAEKLLNLIKNIPPEW